jgi:hypothetical protein
MQEQSLNNFYSQYKNKTIGRDEFEGLIYQYLMKNQEKTNLAHWKHDEYEEFVSCFYLRLKKAIDAYTETGSTFDTFIANVFRKSAKEYSVKTVTKSIIENSAWSIHVPDMYNLYAGEETPLYSCGEDKQNIPQAVFKNGRKNPKQILALILKCYNYVSDDFLERIASLTGLDFVQLKEMIEALRKKRIKRDDEIYHMKERIHCQYYRCIVYEKRLAALSENTTPYLKLEMQLKKARQRLKRMRARFSKVRTDASNREIAEVIGVTKGAVDSNLFNLKNKWEMTAQKAMLN